MSRAEHLPLVEAFYSLRGEGHWTGSPATFLRLGICNLACPGCDTQFDRFLYTPFAEALRFVKSTQCPWVVFTGGEPLLHDTRIAEFQEYVAEQGLSFQWHLETNGTHEAREAEWDWITCSPKVGLTAIVKDKAEGELGYTPYEDLSASLITEANEFKMIIASWARPAREQYTWLKHQVNEDCEFFVQPWKDIGYESNLQTAISFCLEHPEVRLSLQTHKLINVR